jgi:hypothetical protein
MRKLLSILFALISFTSFGQPTRVLSGYDPVTLLPGKIYRDTLISLPYAAGKYITGFGTVGSLPDTTRGYFSGTTNRISYNSTTGVFDISTLYVGQTSLTTLGTIGTGVWNGTAIGTTYGGTNQSTYTTGDLLYASGTNTLSKLAIGSSTQVLTVTGGVPVWAASGGGGGVSSLAAICTVTNANGGSISGTVLTLQPADATNGGVVSNTTQSFTGAKTFTSDITVSGAKFGKGNGSLSENTAGGVLSLNVATGNYNTTYGYWSGRNISTGILNTLIGTEVATGLTTASGVVAIGPQAALVNSTASNVTAIGYNSLIGANGANNLGIGYNSGADLGVGHDNVMLGSSSGRGITGASNYNVWLGGWDAVIGNNQGVVSNNIYITDGQGVHRLTINNIGGVGIGTASTGTPAASTIPTNAALTLESTTTGFLPPRMTTAQRNAITTTTFVKSTTVTNAGSGYTNGTSALSFSGGGGTGATGNIIILAGVINAATITSVGSGYTSAPTVTFSAGAGSGGAVTAVLEEIRGLTVYDTSINKICFYNGTNWQQVTTTAAP